MAGQADSLKSVLFALFANSAIAKGFAAYFTKSGAMLAVILFSVITMQFEPDAMVAVKAKMVPSGSETEMVNAIRTWRTDGG